MIIPHRLATPLILLLLTACAGHGRGDGSGQASPDTLRGAEVLGDDAEDLVAQLKLPFQSLDVLEDQFGSGKEVARRRFPNQHVIGQIDFIVTYRFRGFEAEVYEYPDGSSDLLAIRVLHNRWLERPMVGLHRDAITARIGAAEDVAAGVAWYSCGACAQGEMSLGIRYDQDTVTSVEFRLYYD